MYYYSPRRISHHRYNYQSDRDFARGLEEHDKVRTVNGVNYQHCTNFQPDELDKYTEAVRILGSKYRTEKWGTGQGRELYSLWREANASYDTESIHWLDVLSSLGVKKYTKGVTYELRLDRTASHCVTIYATVINHHELSPNAFSINGILSNFPPHQVEEAAEILKLLQRPATNRRKYRVKIEYPTQPVGRKPHVRAYINDQKARKNRYRKGCAHCQTFVPTPVISEVVRAYVLFYEVGQRIPVARLTVRNDLSGYVIDASYKRIVDFLNRNNNELCPNVYIPYDHK